MPEATTADSLRQRWQGLFEVFQAPPPDPSLFRQRIRFVERNIGIWVKLVLAPVIYWFLFNPNAFGGISVPRRCLELPANLHADDDGGEHRCGDRAVGHG